MPLFAQRAEMLATNLELALDHAGAHISPRGADRRIGHTDIECYRPAKSSMREQVRWPEMRRIRNKPRGLGNRASVRQAGLAVQSVAKPVVAPSGLPWRAYQGVPPLGIESGPAAGARCGTSDHAAPVAEEHSLAIFTPVEGVLAARGA